jgi:hypothetical protein
MALTRGIGGNCPCPVCLVPANMQSKLHISYVRRTAEDAYSIVWNKNLNFGQKDRLLKPLGLRNIEVII